MVLPGESREKLLEEAHIRRIIAPYTQADQVDIYRKRIYDFHSSRGRKVGERGGFFSLVTQRT